MKIVYALFKLIAVLGVLDGVVCLGLLLAMLAADSSFATNALPYSFLSTVAFFVIIFFASLFSKEEETQSFESMWEKILSDVSSHKEEDVKKFLETWAYELYPDEKEDNFLGGFFAWCFTGYRSGLSIPYANRRDFVEVKTNKYKHALREQQEKS